MFNLNVLSLKGLNLFYISFGEKNQINMFYLFFLFCLTFQNKEIILSPIFGIDALDADRSYLVNLSLFCQSAFLFILSFVFLND